MPSNNEAGRGVIKAGFDAAAKAMTKTPARRRTTLASVIGISAAAMLTPLVAKWEGKENRAYRDIVGIYTICYGDTYDVRPGMTQTDAECLERLERQLIAHAEPVTRCIPGIVDHPYQLVAMASLAYNVGPGRERNGRWEGGACGSTAARRMRAGDFRGGCDALMAWVKAGGRTVRGLVNRRTEERRICLTDL